MGNSKKFYWNKQRASKSHKERQHNKNVAAATAFASEGKTNDDDLESFIALMDSIADSYGISKCGASTASKDFNETLGVTKYSTPSDIKKAYNGQAKKLHPDTNKDDPEAEKKLQEVKKAYEVGKDEDKCAQYDQLGYENCIRFGEGGGGEPDQGGCGQGFPFGGSPIGAEDIFSKISGNRDFSGKDVEVALGLSFMEVVQGCTRTVKFQTELPCDACGGSGVPPGTIPEACRRCRGTGMTTQRSDPFGIQVTCSRCCGSGKYVKSLCKSCNGRRVVRGPKSVKLEIMPGVDENETMKVVGSGGADPEGNQPGDLYVTFKVREDPIFRREGPDILSQATLGGTIQVPTLTGDVALKVHPGTQPGQKVVLKKKGRYEKTGNKASKSFKERQRKKNKNVATSASSVSEEKTYDDNRDLEDFIALMDSIADSYGISKCGAAHNFESSPPVEIPSSPPVFIPKRDTGAGYDDQTPPATESGRYKKTDNKASKSFKKRQRKKKNKVATSASASVLEEKANDDSGDLEAFIALMDSIADSYGISKSGAVGNLENEVGIPGVFICKSEARAGCDNLTVPAAVSRYGDDWVPMDTLGVSFVRTRKSPEYNPPVKNSAGNLDNWVGIPGVYIRKRELRAGCDNQTAPTACM